MPLAADLASTPLFRWRLWACRNERASDRTDTSQLRNGDGSRWFHTFL